METVILYIREFFIGIEENNMEIAIVYWGYIGFMV